LTLASQLGNDELRVDAYFDLLESELGGRFEARDQPPVLRDAGSPNAQRPTGLAEEGSVTPALRVAARLSCTARRSPTRLCAHASTL
jgi:hypothetical protein